MKLNVNKFALACGILWGAMMFVVTLISLWTGYANDLLGVMASIYPGYNISVAGSFLGLIEGFIDGFVGCWLFAWLYNLLLG